MCYQTIIRPHKGANSLQHNDNTAKMASQDQILHDIGRDGKPKPWAEHRTETDYMQAALMEINPQRAVKMASCGTWLEFARNADGITLHDANFCRVRLCPLCQWRRSLKIWSQTSDLVAAANNPTPQGWIMLTLTQRNVDDYMLKAELDRLYRAWHDLTHRKEVRKAVLGWMRTLEVSHNTIEGDTAYDTYHPHFHALLQVRPSYFTSRDYIPHHKWAQLWRECMDLDYTPSVEVHRVKGDTAGAIAEVSKYATKPSSILTLDRWDLTIRTVERLDTDLSGRRLIAYGGTLRKLHNQLHLDDTETGDLIHTSTDDPTAREVQDYISYRWAIGYKLYIKASERKGAMPDEDKAQRSAARRTKAHQSGTIK